MISPLSYKQDISYRRERITQKMEPRVRGKANSYKELGMGNICRDGWLRTSDGHVCPGSPTPFLNRNILSSYPVPILPLHMSVLWEKVGK